MGSVCYSLCTNRVSGSGIMEDSALEGERDLLRLSIHETRAHKRPGADLIICK